VTCCSFKKKSPTQPDTLLVCFASPQGRVCVGAGGVDVVTLVVVLVQSPRVPAAERGAARDASRLLPPQTAAGDADDVVFSEQAESNYRSVRR